MRLVLGIALAVVIAVRGGLARADPAGSQVSPVRLQQEDNQRIDAQQRRLEHDRDPGSAGGAAGGGSTNAAVAARELEPVVARRLRIASIVLFGVAGAGALSSVPLLASDPHGSRITGTLGYVLAIGGAGAAGAGFTLFMASRHHVQVAPVVGGSTLGVSLVGQL